MATYKKFCIHCQSLIPGDAATCPACAGNDPFGCRCPKCRNPVEKGWKVCISCGIKLMAICAQCGNTTPAAPACTHCGSPVLVKCTDTKCLEVQIMSTEKICIKCGCKILRRV